MGIIVPIIVWNMAQKLKAAIQSARRVLPDPHIVVLDGVYAQFPYKDLNLQPYSTDGTLEVAQDLADSVISRDEPWPSEIDKRTAYLAFGRPGDLFVHIDADEELEGVWPGVPEDVMDVCLDLRDERFPERPQPLHRVFRHEDGLCYRGTHHLLWVGPRQRLPSNENTLPGLRIRHSINTDTQRAYAKGKYYQWLAENEKGYRGSNMAKADRIQPDRDTTVEFLAATRQVYNGPYFCARRSGDTAVMPRGEALQLVADFPRDFKILGTVELPAPTQAPVPAIQRQGSKLHLQRPAMVKIKYTGASSTRFQGAEIRPNTVVTVTAVLADVLKQGTTWELVDEPKPTAVSPAIPPSPASVQAPPKPADLEEAVETLVEGPDAPAETPVEPSMAETLRTRARADGRTAARAVRVKTR